MKVSLNFDEARLYYQQKGLWVERSNDGYILTKSYSKNAVLKSAFSERRSLKLVIPKEVDYLEGGGFIDPLRMMPTMMQDEGVKLFTTRDLNAVSGWATVGHFWLDGESPVFKLTKMCRAQYLLVCSRWDKQVNVWHTGLENEANLCYMLRMKGLLPQSAETKVLYFDSLMDAYGLSGMDCFVIPLTKNHTDVQNWLRVYRKQKWQLIKFSEAEYRIFKWTKGVYARKILDVLPQKGHYPDNIRNVRRDMDGTRDEIVIEYTSGTCDRYRCDEVGYKKAQYDY